MLKKSNKLNRYRPRWYLLASINLKTDKIDFIDRIEVNRHAVKDEI